MLFLHVGRGKSGSSTIQALGDEHGDFLKAHGVTYWQYGRALDLKALPRAIQDRSPDRSALHHLLALVDAEAGGHVLVSSEYLLNVGPTAIQRLRKALGARPARIILYVRDYPSWLVSQYSQTNKKVRNTLNFDEFFEAHLRYCEIVPAATAWADSFGWESLHLRPLRPSFLYEGDLLRDLLHVMQIEAQTPTMRLRNVSLTWPLQEFMRAYAINHPPERKIEAYQKPIRAMTKLFAQTLQSLDHPPPAQYLTPEQWDRASAIFNDDMRRLGELTGQSIPPITNRPQERPFLPTLEATPAAAREAFVGALGPSGVWRKLGPEVRGTLRRMPGLADLAFPA